MTADRLPSDHEQCGDCGFDHSYEQWQAQRWHAGATLAFARTHAGEGTMASSAELALSDAEELYAEHQYPEAAKRALTSLRYSVGILSPVYQRVKASLGL